MKSHSWNFPSQAGRQAVRQFSPRDRTTTTVDHCHHKRESEREERDRWQFGKNAYLIVKLLICFWFLLLGFVVHRFGYFYNSYLDWSHNYLPMLGRVKRFTSSYPRQSIDWSWNLSQHSLKSERILVHLTLWKLFSFIHASRASMEGRQGSISSNGIMFSNIFNNSNCQIDEN